MGISYSNSTTAKLETFARVRGKNYGIVQDKENASARYFITTEDDQPLSRWKPLGWTVAEAEEDLRFRCEVQPLIDAENQKELDAQYQKKCEYYDKVHAQNAKLDEELAEREHATFLKELEADTLYEQKQYESAK